MMIGKCTKSHMKSMMGVILNNQYKQGRSKRILGPGREKKMGP